MLWASGGFTLRLLPHGPRRESIVRVATPYGLIGRTQGAALTIEAPAVSARHAYLHLDARGLFAVDLATRTGTRVGPGLGPCGWLHPGDRLEIAGREIEVLELRLGDAEAAPEAAASGPSNPLDDTGDAPLVRLTLYPEAGPAEPLILNSELVFVGRSPACGVPVASPAAMRVHCVLVRTRRAAYVVDLVGRGTWKNGRPLREADILQDGETLMVGSSQFHCRLETHGMSRADLPAPAPAPGSLAPAPITTAPLRPATADLPAPPLHLIPPEAQAAVLGWLMNQLQARQDEGARRQSEFQMELVRLVAEIHRDNHTILSRHLERADAIHKELAELREEMKKRFGNEAAPFPALSVPKLPPLNIAPVAPPEDPAAAAGWLIARVNQLDQENRKGWKTLLSRLSGRSDD